MTTVRGEQFDQNKLLCASCGTILNERKSNLEKVDMYVKVVYQTVRACVQCKDCNSTVRLVWFAN